jgi:hypothetical protein
MGLSSFGEFFDHRSRSETRLYEMTMKPTINPYKDQPLARFCTLALRTLGPGLPRKVGQEQRGRLQSNNDRRILRKKTLLTDRATILRGCTEEKLTRPTTVALKEVHQKGIPLPL